MSAPNPTHATLEETKDFLNISQTDTTSNVIIPKYNNMADNYINNQISLHATTVPASDPELVSLGSALAAAQYNYFTSPEKGDLIKDVKAWQDRIQDHIKANYKKEDASGTKGGVLFATTRGYSSNVQRS